MNSTFPSWRPRRITVALVLILAANLALRDPGMAANVVGTVLLGMGLLTLIVIIHELAHALTARLLGVGVTEFGIFFPPRLATLGHVGGVPISLNWIPLGGFTRLAGEKDASVAGGFKAASLSRKVAIILAGPLANLALAYLIFLVLSLTNPLHPPIEAPVRALNALWIAITTVLGSLVAIPGFLISDPGNPPVVGIPGMVILSGQVAAQGLRTLLVFTAIISTSIGLLNLLPLPPLDGGVAMMAAVERFAGARPTRLLTALTAVGLAFIIALAILANGADIIAILTGQNRFAP